MTYAIVFIQLVELCCLVPSLVPYVMELVIGFTWLVYIWLVRSLVPYIMMVAIVFIQFVELCCLVPSLVPYVLKLVIGFILVPVLVLI